MTKPLVSDALWRRVESLFPSPPPRRVRFPGRKPLDYRKILTGIVFVLKTGINWEDLPAELGWGCGKSCKNYLKTWQATGIWTRLYPILAEELREADKVDWSRVTASPPKPRGRSGIVGRKTKKEKDLGESGPAASPRLPP